MDADDFISKLDALYAPLISYKDWLNAQKQMLLAHPPGSIFSIEAVPIAVRRTRTPEDKPGPRVTDMDNNYYWRFFAYLSEKRYTIMIKVVVSYVYDRSPTCWTRWVEFAKFNEYLDGMNYKSASGHQSFKMLFTRWFIQHPLAPGSK